LGEALELEQDVKAPNSDLVRKKKSNINTKHQSMELRDGMTYKTVGHVVSAAHCVAAASTTTEREGMSKQS
jgi:hypothetical protein